MSNTTDITRPTVTVRIPDVRLRLQDLAFLRSIGQDKSVRCVVPSSTKDRLRFLDLIARAKVQQSREVAATVAQEIKRHREDLTKAIKNSDWSAVTNIGYQLRNCAQRLQPIEDDVLTEKGKALLESGEVRVRVRKVGCA